jgi:hypothetical protein
MAEQEAILAEEIAAGFFEPLPGGSLFLVDPDTGPPEGADAWLGALASPARDAILDARAAAEPWEPDGAFPAGVIARDGSGPGGPGFADGSALDRLEPGPVLSGALDDVWQAGLTGLSDDEVAGIALAGQRQESRGAAAKLAGAAELARRREATGDWRVIEQTDTEIALLLTMTRRSAANLLEFAISLARLPATMAALHAGRIDRGRADVIAYETALLDDKLAVAVEQLVIEDAPSLTTGKLRARVRAAVLAADPDAARRQAEAAAKDARVELINERAGTAGLAGRDLPVPATLAADQRIDAWARQLKADGAKARLTQLRAAAFLALLTGQDPLTFLPAADAEQEPPAAAQDDEPVAGTTPAGPDSEAGPGSPRRPDSPTGPDSQAGPDGPGQDGQAGPDGAAKADTAAGDRLGPSQPGRQDGSSGDGSGPGRGTPGPLALRGSVHLAMPLAAWLGLTRSPGDIAGFGPATAETCRQLADLIAQDPGSRWCLTLTDAAGHAVGHGCAHRPPPAEQGTGPPGGTGPPPDGPPGGTPRPPGTPPAPPGGTARQPDGTTAWLDAITAWLGGIKTGPVEAGTCSHAREVPGYRLPESLHHIIKTRQKTCSNPICARPATRCDDDHVLPYDQGGRSCECDVSPECRTDHQAKQAPGWYLEEPSPGVLIWHTPHGRRYTATPGTYPT